MNFLIKIPLIKILVILSVFFQASLFFQAPVFFQASMVYAISIPQTGQTTCYDETGAVISCTNTGQDGDIQAGVVWPANHFADNGDGTLTDGLTGLMWMQNGNLLQATGASPAGKLTWQQALDFVKDLNSGMYPPYNAGYTDWRLPNYNEMESLINYEEAPSFSWLNANGFMDLKSDIYWSSTTRVYPGQLDETWGIVMWNGTQTAQDKDQLFNLIVVRGVSDGPAQVNRTGQQTCYDESGTVISCAGTGQDGEWQTGATWPIPRFIDMGNGTIKDELTGLIWLKDGECLDLQIWNDMFIIKNDFNTNPGNYPCMDYTATHNDWRIPNIRELSSLYDFSQAGPGFPADHLFIVSAMGYLIYSYSNFADNSLYTFGTYLMEPTSMILYKPWEGRVWLVRDAGPDCEPAVKVMQVWSEDNSGVFNVDFTTTDNLTTNSAVTIAGCDANTYKLVIKYQVFDANGVKYYLGKQVFPSVGMETYSSNFTAAFPADFAVGQSKIQVKGKLYFDGTILTTDKHHGWIDVE
ncbi:MAG: DUF1566 domain-containing protein [Desulfobacteraceae bacterium]|nr:DUF1566 domain-containing protein [Desulfobacteraceae bacterium]